MKNIIKTSVLITALFSTHAMAIKSSYVCDVPLFDGFTKGKKAEFIVCESGEDLTVTLINIEENKVAEDIKIPKRFAKYVKKDDAKHFMVMRTGDVSGGGYSFSETLIDGEPFRIMIVQPPEGEKIVVEMARPKINQLGKTLATKGITVEVN